MTKGKNIESVLEENFKDVCENINTHNDNEVASREQNQHRLMELYYIVQGIQAERQRLLSEAQAEIDKLIAKANADASPLDEILATYTTLHSELLARMEGQPVSEEETK